MSKIYMETGNHVHYGYQVIMTHLGRSGSTVIAEMLKQHPNIAWFDEFFTKLQNEHSDFNLTVQEMLALIGKEVDLKDQSNIVYFGHEIKPINFFKNHGCNISDYLEASADHDKFTHVFLRRRNILRRICSAIKASQTGVYHTLNDGKGYVSSRYYIDFENLIDYDSGQKAGNFRELIDMAIGFEDEIIKIYKNNNIKYLEIFYEESIEKDPSCAYKKIVNYLGIQEHAATVYFKKTTGDLRSEIINWNMLESQLAGSEYEWMLN